MDVKIGVVTHYYDKIGVAVVNLTKTLKTGDMIKVSGHDKEFNQEVTSLQVEHQPVTSIAAGKSGALKTDQPVKDGDILYKVAKK